MKNFFLSLLLLSFAAPALANPIKSPRTEYLDSGAAVALNSVAITGFTPYQYVKVGLGTLGKSAKTACNGYLRVDIVSLPAKPTEIVVDGNRYTVASAQTRLLQCATTTVFPNGQLVDQTRAGVLTLPPFFKSGLDGRYYIKVASSPGVIKDLAFVGVSNDRSIRADACGMVTLKDSKAAPWTASTEIKVGSNTYTVGSIVDGSLPKCARVGTEYKLFSAN